MNDANDGGWSASAAAWIADQADGGDFGRKHVLDRPLLARIDDGAYRRALDVGCGEGRLCRMLRARGVETTGVDPTGPLLDEARRRDPNGDYRAGRAEALDFDDGAFDLVVSCLSLIDIADHRAAIAEMARVLAPGGTLLIANTNSFVSAGAERGWLRTADGALDCYPVDQYLRERSIRSEWRGISVVNHHRPLSSYMQALIGQGLVLAHFDEPVAHSGPEERVAKYQRAPWFVLMEWRKPGDTR